MDEGTKATVSILTAILGVAALAVIFSTKATTSSVLGAFGTSFSQILGTALSPITGSGSSTTIPTATG